MALFATIPILLHLDFIKALYIQIYAFKFALGVVLLQMGEYKMLHLVAFYCKNIINSKN